MVAKEGIRKIVNALILLLLIVVSSFIVFSYLSIRTNINVANSAVSVIMGATDSGMAVTLERLSSALTNLSLIVFLELVVLGAGIISLLLAIFFLARIYFFMRKTAYIDELTQIYNKRALHTLLDREIKRADRFKHPLTVIMVDIDHFKDYNDKNGHQAGDKLLKKIAEIFVKKLRDVDFVARYGGEEFTIVLPETAHKSAIALSERIRKAVEEMHFKGVESQPGGRITISMGLVTHHGEYGERHEILESADKLLYQAKREGRNRLIGAYFKK